MDNEGLALVWALDGGEYHPARLLGILEDGSYQVSFLGWSRRHDNVVPAFVDGRPSMLFEKPRPRKPLPSLDAECASPRSHTGRKRTRVKKRAEVVVPCRCDLEENGGATEVGTAKRMKLVVAVPQSLTCTACSIDGDGGKMLCCIRGCGTWAHRGCTGIEDGAQVTSFTFTCLRCQPLHNRGTAKEGEGTADEEQTLLRALREDRVMERDLRKHLHRHGLKLNRSSDLPEELRSRLMNFLTDRLEMKLAAEPRNEKKSTIADDEQEEQQEDPQEHCSLCNEVITETCAHSSCDFCHAVFHSRCDSSSRHGSCSKPFRDATRCPDCRSIAAAVAVASARSFGWATADIFKDARGLRDAVKSTPHQMLQEAISLQASAAACRERKRLTARQEVVELIPGLALHAAMSTATRLRRALDERQSPLPFNGEQDLHNSLCRQVLECGNADLFYHTFLFNNDTATLRAVACVCQGWSRLLDRARSSQACSAWQRSWLVAPRGKLTLPAAVRSTRPGDRVKIAAGTHSCPLILPHALEVVGEDDSILTGPITLGSPGGSARIGSLSNVRVEHFYDTAVTAFGGKWCLNDVQIVSSRAPSRACVGVVLRGSDTQVTLNACVISDCSAAVQLASTTSRLFAHDSIFQNARVIIEALKSGFIDLRRSSLDVSNHSDVGLRLASDTVGMIALNTVTGNGSLWGRALPPYGVEEDDAREESE